MDEIDLDVTSIELGMICAAHPVRPFESYRPVFSRSGTAMISLKRDEILDVLMNLDEAIDAQIPKMVDRVKADLFVKNKSKLVAKLRRALICPVEKLP